MKNIKQKPTPHPTEWKEYVLYAVYFVLYTAMLAMLVVIDQMYLEPR